MQLNATVQDNEDMLTTVLPRDPYCNDELKFVCNNFSGKQGKRLLRC